MRKKSVPHTHRVHETSVAPPILAGSEEGFEEIHEIRNGFPVGAFFDLQEVLGIGTAQLAEVVGIPLRTLQRRKEEGIFTKEESDRLHRVRQLVSQATGIFASEASAREWLTRPQIGLAGLVPIELADTGAGIREVETLLGRIDYGVYA